MVLGGRSMGGRMCSMAVAEGLPAAGLVLISYPLHPPGRPDRLRIEHLPRLNVPCLFVSGTRDAFGTPAELEAATQAIPGPVTHEWIDGKDHGLRGAEDEVAGLVMAWLERTPRPGPALAGSYPNGGEQTPRRPRWRRPGGRPRRIRRCRGPARWRPGPHTTVGMPAWLRTKRASVVKLMPMMPGWRPVARATAAPTCLTHGSSAGISLASPKVSTSKS